MNIKEFLTEKDKEMVFELYTRIIEDFKDYEKISKKKMIEEIIKEFSKDDVIEDLCSLKELEFLELLSSGKYEKLKNEEKDKIIDKYDFQIFSLIQKNLIYFDDTFHIYSDIKDYVKNTLKTYDKKVCENSDNLNAFLIGMVKTYGNILEDVLVNLASDLYHLDKNVILTFMEYNKNFNFNVYKYSENIPSLKEDKTVLIYQDYYELKDELDERRKEFDSVGMVAFDPLNYISLYDNYFNINNKKIKKFVDEFNKNDLLNPLLIASIDLHRLMNLDRENFEELLKSELLEVYNSDKVNYLIKLMNEAMDEMPSGVLNGSTLNEYKKHQKDKVNQEVEKLKENLVQVDAKLSEDDTELFYKLYFGLLDYVNKKNNIKPNFKIYKAKKLNPRDVYQVVDTLWKQRNIIDEFVKVNPYKFNDEELEIVKGFKNAKRDIFFVYKFLEDYTVFASTKGFYMVKGLTGNLDVIISRDDLPYPTMTTLLEFKGNIVYDGLLGDLLDSYGINMDKVSLKKLLDKEYENGIKQYHL